MEGLRGVMVQLGGSVIGLCYGAVIGLWKGLVGRWYSLMGQ